MGSKLCRLARDKINQGLRLAAQQAHQIKLLGRKPLFQRKLVDPQYKM